MNPHKQARWTAAQNDESSNLKVGRSGFASGMTLTSLELDIMKAVWENPPVTVKTVQAAIRPHRHLAYTTVMTVMHRLFQKGFLLRRLQSRAHFYEPAISYIEVRDKEVARILDDFFAGSRENLVEFLGGQSTDGAATTYSAQPSTADLDETLL